LPVTEGEGLPPGCKPRFIRRAGRVLSHPLQAGDTPATPPGFIQKYIFSEEELVKNLDNFFRPDIVYFSLEIGLRFLESILRYIFEATKIEPDTILEKLPMLPDGAKEAIMTTAEKLRKQGRQQGKQAGKLEGKLEDARRMLEKGYPFEDICEITGLSRDEVEKLKSRES
jgi:hypothetical protein